MFIRYSPQPLTKKLLHITLDKIYLRQRLNQYNASPVYGIWLVYILN